MIPALEVRQNSKLCQRCRNLRYLEEFNSEHGVTRYCRKCNVNAQIMKTKARSRLIDSEMIERATRVWLHVNGVDPDYLIGGLPQWHWWQGGVRTILEAALSN